MTVAEIQQLAREVAERSAAAQGLPAKITDPRAIAQVASLLDRPTTRTRRESRATTEEKAA